MKKEEEILPVFENTERIRLFDLDFKELFDQFEKIEKTLTDIEIDKLNLRFPNITTKHGIIERIILYKKIKGLIVSEIVKLPKVIYRGPISDDVFSFLVLPEIDVSGLLSLLQVDKKLQQYELDNRIVFWKNVFTKCFPEYIGINFSILWEKTLPNDNKKTMYDVNTWKRICIWLTWAHRRILKQFEQFESSNLKLLRNEDGKISTISLVIYKNKIISTSVFADENGFYKGRLLAWSNLLTTKQRKNRTLLKLEKQKLELIEKFDRELLVEGVESPKEARIIFNTFIKLASNNTIDLEIRHIPDWSSYHKEHYQVGPRTTKDGRSVLFLGERQCVICDTPTKLVCKDCKKVAYCGKECQAEHWHTEHAKQCVQK